MNFSELSEKAYKKQEISEFANLAEKYAYLQLCNLYRDYENEFISKIEAMDLKVKIKKEYDEYQNKIKDYYEIFKKQNEIRANYHTWIVNINKSTKEEDMLINCLKFIEKIIADDSFFDMNYSKIENQKK